MKELLHKINDKLFDYEGNNACAGTIIFGIITCGVILIWGICSSPDVLLKMLKYTIYMVGGIAGIVIAFGGLLYFIAFLGWCYNTLNNKVWEYRYKKAREKKKQWVIQNYQNGLEIKFYDNDDINCDASQCSIHLSDYDEKKHNLNGTWYLSKFCSCYEYRLDNIEWIKKS